MKYYIMRFYGGGELADWTIVNCKSEELYEHLKDFEKDCITRNLGSYTGFLSENEVNYILKNKGGLK